MKIATLQFAPRVGEVAANFSRAETLLMRREQAGELDGLDLLVLPEMAFSGYNHPSLSAISPYLEPTAAGPSTRWASRTAKRLKCTVMVGYPEAASVTDATAGPSGNYNTVYDHKITQETRPDTVAYNSLVMVDCHGEVVGHYRKTFLYYTDETWAREGPDGFYTGVVPIGDTKEMVKTAVGICMDINPYKFEAPWTAYEFANHCREAKVSLAVISMAWLTRLSHEDVFGASHEGGHDTESARIQVVPDMDTVSYWVERFRPMLGVNGPERETIMVFANRVGEEGQAEIVGEVRYAGSSCVMGMKKGRVEGETNVRIWNTLGRGEDGILVVDTDSAPLYEVQRRSTGVCTDDEKAAETMSAVETEVEAREVTGGEVQG